MAEQPPDPRIEALIAAVRSGHGERIPEEQAARLRVSVVGLREAIAAVYAYPLTNADEPDPIFAAYRGED